MFCSEPIAAQLKNQQEPQWQNVVSYHCSTGELLCKGLEHCGFLLARVYKYTPNRRWNSCEQTSSKAHLPHSKSDLLSTNRGNRMTERDNKSVIH
jgi:hypothetical protein